MDDQAKIEKIAKDCYGAGNVTYSEKAERQIENYTRLGFAALPICMAKTQYSFSADANAKGAPSGFTLPIREVIQALVIEGIVDGNLDMWMTSVIGFA